MRVKLILLLLLFVITGCGVGGDGDILKPNPNQTPGKYMGIPYDELGNPIGFNNYPSQYFPTFVDNSSDKMSPKIAYGRNDLVMAMNLVAYVDIYNYFCSATPVHYDPVSDTTFLISAAHCFVNYKKDKFALTSTELENSNKVNVNYGNGLTWPWNVSFAVKNVFLMRNYCYGATFNDIGGCPNFTDNDGVSGGQGHDLAVVQIAGKFANPNYYPILVPESKYPDPLTMAPILSIGYGAYTQTPILDENELNNSVLFYVARYYYIKTDSQGYHYLYSSYFNPLANGYTQMICGGDSGGGDLFWNGQNWLLLAEHTFGPDNSCGNFFSYLPDGATSVGHYYDWIEGLINSESPVIWCKIFGNNCITNSS